MSEPIYDELAKDIPGPIEGEVLVEGTPDKLEILGKIAKIIAGYGAGVIVGQIIDANVQPKHLLQKIGIYAGGLALCGLAAHHAGNYAKEYTEEAIETVRNISKKIEEVKEEIRVMQGFLPKDI